ncbi:restriction endonuclease subunit S [Vibrio sp. 10N.286.49.B3]|uniref:restriction endonuclease subunit S n=1 Tax=Vibrio sp. 10N.286.49.B3 TaxID=1880855 RepID=UPI000C829EF3|nr:restriction endonuclease subunit S [Vibrio sp. 10N.286.49.B3]
MSCNWPTVALGKYCSKIGSGATPRGGSSVYLDSGEITLIRSQNIYNDGFKAEGLVYITSEAAQKLKNVIIESNDILINITGDSVARVCLAPKEYLPARVNQHVAILRVKPDEFDHRYLRYFLTSTKMQNYLLTIASTGATRNALTKSMLESLEISKPPLDIQRNIGDVLEQFENKILLNTKTNQTLEEMAQAIFKSWFVDFDPVKAKMNGEQPEGMDAATASLFPEKLVESELGLIPEGWEVGTLSDVAKYCSARTNTDTITLENYISTENMLAEKKGVTAASKLPTAKTVAAYKSGDILVSNIRPYFKKIWLAEGSGGRSNDVLGFESVSANSDSYLMNLLYQDTFFEYMTRTSKGAKMPRGDKTAIMNWEMAVPPVELRETFSAIVDKFYQLIPQNRAQNATLVSLRDTLLPKLLSGEIELDIAEVNLND